VTSTPQSDALLALKKEQLELFEAARIRSPYYSNSIDSWVTITQKMKRQIETDKVDFFVSPLNNGLVERAYLAPNDGSPQPYWLSLPENYNPQKKWPLIIFLHGYSTSISKITPWLPSEDTIRSAKERGYILAITYGRRNSDFVQWGQDDIISVKREIEQIYSVDKNKTMLMGASMGGYGAYAAGLHTTGEFAAIAPISARSDMFYWFKTTPEEIPDWKRMLYWADNPRTLAPNARSTPIFTQHGALDIVVPVEHSRLFTSDAKNLKLPYRLYEDPEGDHWGDFQYNAIERAFSWFKMQRYAPPRRITLVTADLRESKAHYAQINAFEKYDQLARLDVDVQSAKIAVTTNNVTSFSINIPSSLFNAGALVPLEVNGLEVKLADPALPINWNKAGAKLEKTSTRTGVFKNLMRDPFLLVYGDNNDVKAARKFASEWKESADGDAKIKSASQVTPSDKANFNLILFGTRSTNPLVGAISHQLPIELTSTGYKLGDGEIGGENLGLRMVWKSPWNKNRLIGICSGAWWGERLPLNHKWDLIPDYIVYDGEKFEKDDTNQAIEAGFFNGNWEIDIKK
jgi:acetyl esterase/lipase